MKRILAGLILTAILLTLTACSSQEPKTVVIASKPHSEQYILAEMLSLLIENHTDIKVEKKLGIGGGTSNIHPAMLSGDFDIYPEYTGTGLLFVLKEDLITDSDELYKRVQDRYLEEYNIKWLGLYGFNNTYALAVKESTAQTYNLETYDDLALASKDLVFGAEHDFFERDDGYEALKDVYGFEFKDTKEMDIGLKYEAIGSDEVDVINAFSTDGLIKQYNLKVLEDNKNFFPAYQAATLIRKETLDKYPELEAVLGKLTGQISDDEMIQMNYQVEKENMDPRDVAEQFLKAKGLI
ncbi:Substrate-binding region of ABC-type glycine betaine transport system precursor [Acetoanaerobium sticklandii]|uniref:Substrate-binding region of ABC-type glycine betaine transport system n=1 Tax=Acetoanaerobium sticklandii (strain ATCC 12662 / DSM 519 / JCM 1433 / CCUG 9281 / NCIMB 10654 / HF) TaxID=499177 RepID=E3PR94_ACESD|nr:glycine betaine ABC transporter substrate-binding protein [Acetoanaerobium sticklandii]CBH20159.1 Substrate-binding region of ABC-type glycine betaine transport system precursor [Acetoanaerobium sticklandii]